MNMTGEITIERRAIPANTSKRFMLVAGPCSAESLDQVLKTAHQLKSSEVDFFRAGLWKPRTRPGHFEGIGNKGLEWMVQVRKETGLKIVTEVANRSHVEAVLAAGFDAVWIGARTTANPFSVQEIAEALRGSSVTVFIKNPVNPDIQLWIGAIERVRNMGIKDVVAVHRGFSPFAPSKYRNIPLWKIPQELMKAMPEIPLLCDPSHIAGRRDLLDEVASKALASKMNGLFIETHIDPDSAQSDKDQQITPAELDKLLCSMADRKAVKTMKQSENLSNLRAEIDCWDHKLLNTLRNRMRTANRIGEYKTRNNFPFLQKERWQELMDSRIREGKALGLSAEFLTGIFEQIHDESLKFQNGILK